MVTIMTFSPWPVVCSRVPFPRDATVLNACQAILDNMETSQNDVTFAQDDVHTQGETPVPFSYVAPDQGITTRFQDPPK